MIKNGLIIFISTAVIMLFMTASSCAKGSITMDAAHVNLASTDKCGVKDSCADAAAKKILKLSEMIHCQKNSDCTLVKENCCSCNAGGKQIAISVRHADKYKKALLDRCADIMCTQVISDDPSCKKKAICSNKKCVLK